jgi:hypothetical protein
MADTFSAQRTVRSRAALRQVAGRDPVYARTASLDDLLGAILKITTPIVADFLRGAQTGSAGTGHPPSSPPLEAITQLLHALLASPVAGATTLSRPFMNRQRRSTFSSPFVFGIDDALLGSLAGSVLQILPQLINAANQRRIELRKADNQLTQGILAGINQRLMLERLADAQRKAAPGDTPSAEQLQTLVDIIAQANAAAAPAPGSPAPAPAGAQQASTQQSLRGDRARAFELSNRATLTFEMAEAIEWGGSRAALYDRSKDISLQVRLNVGEPVPKAPLPKAILTVVLRSNNDPSIRFEKTFRLRGILAGGLIRCAFAAGELAHLPKGQPITVLGQTSLGRVPRRGRNTGPGLR